MKRRRTSIGGLSGLAVPIAVAVVSSSGASSQLRFHHLHLRTTDPAAAMNDVAGRVDATRVIVQGLGVGVRVGDHYILFDRGESSRGPDPGGAAAAYTAAVRWLAARHFEVTPRELSATDVPAARPEGAVDHLAFAAAELDAAVAALQRAGAEPFRRTGESAFFATGDGMVVEVARDNDRPDAFWCPMHPDLKSPARDKCPICSMELVPISPPTLGGYRLGVTQIPSGGGKGGKGIRALQLEIQHPETAERVTAFSEIHERPLHLFIVRRDLSYFAHVHPEKRDDRFEAAVDLGAGAYVLVADFVPVGGSPQLVQHAIATHGYDASPFAEAILHPDLSEKIAGGLRISLSADTKAGKDSALRFTVRDSATGALAADLEPYLGAPGHVLIVSPDLTHVIHAHPEGSAAATPVPGVVVFEPVLPAPGTYKLWVQFQRKGQVITAPFAIEAR